MMIEKDKFINENLEKVSKEIKDFKDKEQWGNWIKENPDYKEKEDIYKEQWGDWIKENFEIKLVLNYERNLLGCLPKNDGKWSGKVGNSDWVPDNNVIPRDKNGKTNPENKTWREIKEEFNFESVKFKNDEADFSEFSKGTVEIDDFTEARYKNFAQADEKLANQRGCTPQEVKKWRVEHKYTWHECNDCKTMQKVPSKVHGNIPHSGGISEKRKELSIL